MRSILVLALVAACGAKSTPPPPPSNEPPPPAEGSGSATTTPPDEGQICGTRGAAMCPANMFCNFQPGAGCGEADRPGHCMVAPEMCPQIFQPVCGCDGKTHPNSCQAASAKTGVRAAGECPK
ncbi:MAG: Kazal-type serine protease inhibitor domain-containing protein [Kofleriaceae bacterium]